MSTTRRVFPEVFKHEAVDRVISSGLSVGKVAAELGLSETVLGRWVMRLGGAGGCFWGVQGVFQHVAGFTSAISGYTGGTANTAHYGVVSMTATGHAESVRVVFDPPT